MSDFVYLDNAATTFPKPEVVYAEQDRVTRTLSVNAGRGSYRASHEASEIISGCRAKMAALVGCKEEHLIFTPSATIGMNQIILGLSWNQYKVVYVSPYEHNAVIRPLHRICMINGIEFRVLAIADDGSLDLERIAIQFAKQPPNYVFITHVSNVTGYILPIREVAEMAHHYKAVVVADCSQSMGLLDTSLESLDADFLVFAGHKTLYANFGIGGWAARDVDMLEPVICGGTGSDSLNQAMPEAVPGRFEAASPNIIAIAALNKALQWRSGIPAGEMEERERALTVRLVEGLSRNKNIGIYLTNNVTAHIGTVSFNHKRYMADELGMILDQDFNIAVRTGYHCAPLIHGLLNSLPKRGTVRASVSYLSKDGDVDALLAALKDLD